MSDNETDHIEVIEETKQTLKDDPKNLSALFKQGCAYFRLDEYETAVTVLKNGLALAQQSTKDEDKQFVSKFGMWIRKCNTNLSPDKQVIVETKDASVPAAAPAVQPQQPVPQPTPAPAPAAASSSSSNPTPAALPKNTALVRFEWYQTQTNVLISFFVKDRTEKDVEVNVTSSKLDVSINLGNGREYQHTFARLYGPVDPSTCSHTVTKYKVEIKLVKTSPIQWKNLERAEDETPATTTAPTETTGSTAAPAASTAARPAYPSSSTKKKNWDQVEKEVEKEDAETKEEGDAALNKLFRDIYGRADDDTRRAMMKSFSESGGTVLSTNWKEVGAKKVEGTPPQGMEFKKYEM